MRSFNISFHFLWHCFLSVLQTTLLLVFVFVFRRFSSFHILRVRRFFRLFFALFLYISSLRSSAKLNEGEKCERKKKKKLRTNIRIHSVFLFFFLTFVLERPVVAFYNSITIWHQLRNENALIPLRFHRSFVHFILHRFHRRLLFFPHFNIVIFVDC